MPTPEPVSNMLRPAATIPIKYILSKAWPWSSCGRSCYHNTTALVVPYSRAATGPSQSSVCQLKFSFLATAFSVRNTPMLRYLPTNTTQIRTNHYWDTCHFHSSKPYIELSSAASALSASNACGICALIAAKSGMLGRDPDSRTRKSELGILEFEIRS
jgi:hypothetical protein